MRRGGLGEAFKYHRCSNGPHCASANVNIQYDFLSIRNQIFITVNFGLTLSFKVSYMHIYVCQTDYSRQVVMVIYFWVNI